MKKQNVRTLSLIVCTFTYLLIGAAVFDALESETEKRRRDVLDYVERKLIQKYSVSTDDFKLFETIILKSEPHKAGQQWKFAGAFYYATTVLTTIGYGHSTPSTVAGKLFTMFYAIMGIPLGLVMFQSIGERLNKFSSHVIQKVKRVMNCKDTDASEINLICVVTTLSGLTVAGGAAAFSRYEGWTYFDSVYYCFITLTTIGFGDMVALQKDNALATKPEYVAFALIFILFGLAIVAASLNLLVLRFVTMNTEDERRDEAEALQAMQGAVRLEGDVITANGSIMSGQGGHGEHIEHTELVECEDDNASVCSLPCGCLGRRDPGPRAPPSPPPYPGHGRHHRPSYMLHNATQFMPPLRGLMPLLLERDRPMRARRLANEVDWPAVPTYRNSI
ncbi:two pore potassium channel protein sup-9-like [Frankliniella occidentalis]|uniref:Two pore potassium channel protein sup-9-like n=1 Tax=Frankliniella occidentalis TaxID=133901 RepID=A0A9C6X1V1_FRAOC|nr:two pore potassium channel protein sup-9-like [Frankliniella occidentalis]